MFFFYSSLDGSKIIKILPSLDAGHGGKDLGNSYHGFTEKDMAKTTLKWDLF
jgi:N-acetylmuramoyl-L-alanine amidase